MSAPGGSLLPWSDGALRRIDDFCLAADLSGTDLLVCDLESQRFVACNRSAHSHLGYSQEELLSLGPEAIQGDPDHDAPWLAARFQELVTAGASRFDTLHRCKDNTITAVEVASQVVSLDGRQYVVSMVLDRTESLQREQQLRENLQLLIDGEAISAIGSWDLRFADGRMRWSPQMRHLCGNSSANASEIATLWAYASLVHPDDRSRWRQEFQRAVIRGDQFLNRHRITRDDGTEMMVEQRAQLSYDHEGQPLRAVGTIRDIGQQESLLEQQSWQRSCDPLTGLPNKLACLQELDQRLKGRSYNDSLAVLSLDVDGFQEINDNFGSDVGDQLLKAMARRLKELLACDAWIGRLTSDQFLIILEDHIHSLGMPSTPAANCCSNGQSSNGS
jgi:PAS domain S-box-containing protein